MTERYTLDEARALLRGEQCRGIGHSYEITYDLGREDPTAVRCPRCGKYWPVEGELAEHPVVQAAIKLRDNAKARKHDLNELGIINAVNEAGL